MSGRPLGRSLFLHWRRMEPIDVNLLFGDRYKIDRDEAAAFEPGGKHDPWLFLIPCRYGHIGPFSDNLLAVYCDSRRLIRNLVDLPGIIPKQIGETEAILAFPPELFGRVAHIVKPRLRRRLSQEHRQSLHDAGREHRYKQKSPVLSARDGIAGRTSEGQPSKTSGRREKAPI